MSEGLEQLRSLGAPKIYADTHIPLQHIRAILQEDFSSFHKVQLAGFFSILEREYGLDLAALRKSADEEFSQRAETEDKGIFVTPEIPKNGNKKLYFALAILFLIAILLYNILLMRNSEKEIESVDNRLIESVTQSIEPKQPQEQESNTTLQAVVPEISEAAQEETNSSVEEVAQEEKVVEIAQEEAVVKTFKVTANTKVWAGYIDTKANKKHQKTFKGTLELDPQKSWLFVFGHPYVNFSINGKSIVFKSRKSKRFFYNNGEIRPVTAKEFKRLNRGRRW
jgi:Glu-tRNA(Gln) amidotransferase subunit E-like FAD-binding protein